MSGHKYRIENAFRKSFPERQALRSDTAFAMFEAGWLARKALEKRYRQKAAQEIALRQRALSITRGAPMGNPVTWRGYERLRRNAN